MAEDRQLLYKLWLALVCDHEPEKIHRLLKKYGSAEAAFEANRYGPDFSGALNMADALRLHPDLDSAAELLETCRRKEIQVISLDDPAYPALLKEADCPPLALYALGTLPDLNRLACVAVVGTRRCTQQGGRFAFRLGQELAESGLGVVSGMALGTDGAAHWGALAAGGVTLAVLAGGVDVVYPPEHEDLYRHILTHGAAVSERPPGTLGQSRFYRQRNRIIAGLSLGAVIVEGLLRRSGTGITAHLAQRFNRDVFAVPGNPENVYAALPNSLLQDGAKLVNGAMDVVEEYLGLYPEKLEYGLGRKGRPVVGMNDYYAAPKRRGTPPPKPVPKSVPEPAATLQAPSQEALEERLERAGMTEAERQVLRFLWKAGPDAAFDDIADACGLEAGTLSSILIILQMKKAVSQSPGGRYALALDGLA